MNCHQVFTDYRPLVSILIPSYNAGRWIKQAVESALAQTYEPKEVIVIDDGSTDNCPEILRGFADRIRFVSRENRGGNPTRNELVSLSSGEWLQFLDADDYLEPEKIARQIAILNKDKGEQADPCVDVIYSPVRIERWSSAEKKVIDPVRPISDDPWVLHARWALAQTGGALFRRSALLEVGGWDEKQACCQDNELLFRLLLGNKKFRYCRGAVAVYREFCGGTVSTNMRSEVRMEILRILDATEDYLKEVGKLTFHRLDAINQHRFWQARNLWSHDRALSGNIMQSVRRSCPKFYPEVNRHSPKSYQIIYRVFGFATAEFLAGLKRKWK